MSTTRKKNTTVTAKSGIPSRIRKKATLTAERIQPAVVESVSKVITRTFVVGARPPALSKEESERLNRQRPSKKAARLAASVAKAKVIINY